MRDKDDDGDKEGIETMKKKKQVKLYEWNAIVIL